MDESLEVMVARTDDGARLPTRGSEYAWLDGIFMP